MNDLEMAREISVLLQPKNVLILLLASILVFLAFTFSREVKFPLFGANSLSFFVHVLLLLMIEVKVIASVFRFLCCF